FASFLLGYVDSAQIDTVRFIGQQFPYYAGYAQDDWHVNKKLFLNLGLRYDVNLPPTGLNDRWADFSPTTPNPGAGGRLGAVLFAGSGPGRVGTRSLADSWFGGWGPHFGFAYTLDEKTVLRGSYARSFGQLMAVTGSSHTSGFTLTDSRSNPNNGLTPLFQIQQGFPPYNVPPFINPAVSNGTTVAWWQGDQTTRLPESNNFNVSVQRQLSPSMILEVSYNAVIGSHPQSQVLV